jgi:16S rRNA processing protein RimM
MPDRPQPPYLLLGEILRPHGVRGEIRVRVLTEYPERLPKMSQVYIGNSPEASANRPVAIERARVQQGYALIKLSGIDTRDQAELLRGQFLMVATQDAVPLEDDEIYLYELIDMTVVTEAGDALGRLMEVIETGANDVYVINSPAYGEVLIPATPEVVLSVDTTTRTIRVRLLDGLLPE